MIRRCDFYILSDENAAPFAVKLIEKAYLAGLRVLVFAQNHTQAEQLDQLLWTFKEVSFIPHALANTPEATHSPIIIVYNQYDIPDSHYDTFVNLTNELPTDLNSIERLLEVIPSDLSLQQSARERFKTYRAHGFELHTHKIGG